jgi:hypothetical protein
LPALDLLPLDLLKSSRDADDQGKATLQASSWAPSTWIALPSVACWLCTPAWRADTALEITALEITALEITALEIAAPETIALEIVAPTSRINRSRIVALLR